MLRQMEWSKRTKQIATELERSPTTITRMLREPVDRPLPPRRRVSKVDLYRPQIETEFNVGRSAVRILERARGLGADRYRYSHDLRGSGAEHPP